ncbi:MAG: DNA repair protein RadA [Acidimicrobiia bacterium]|nr:DNA repair protein RadA [Acidimicrobiia bacterium]
MARPKVVHRCSACGAQAASWLGRCPSCDEWNTLEPFAVAAAAARPTAPATAPTPIGDVERAGGTGRPTGLVEVDRALGGGLFPGSVTLLGGPPGIGKSTLLLQLAAQVGRTQGRVLYLSAEESPAQVRHRAERLGCLDTNLLVASETTLDAVETHLGLPDLELVIVDSVQTVADPDLSSATGSVQQVRQVAHRLVERAKRKGLTLILVGHVTKDGALAGPRVLEHLVDTVLSFEGDRTGELRVLRAVKHRFGPTTEVGLLEMTEQGVEAVADPSGRFLADRRPGVPGSVVVPTIDGQRPVLVEVQALVAPAVGSAPRRSAQGLDSARLALLLAVLDRRVGLRTVGADVYVSVAGGARVSEPASDLAVALAVASAGTGLVVSPGAVACGEVGLGGELRRIAGVDRRLAEAARLGFTKAIVPASVDVDLDSLEIVRCHDLATAVDRLVDPGSAPIRPTVDVRSWEERRTGDQPRPAGAATLAEVGRRADRGHSVDSGA